MKKNGWLELPEENINYELDYQNCQPQFDCYVPKKSENLKLMKRNNSQIFYQMMKDVHELFVSKGIPYWLNGGTLLGAVRHKGIIPWDDDADFFFHDYDSERIIDLQDDLARIGYKLDNAWFGFKVYPMDGYSILNYIDNLTGEKVYFHYKYPFLDLFPMTYNKKKNIYNYTVKRAKKKWGYKCNFRKEDLFPLKLYDFGNFQLYGPNNPYPYLDKCFPDWPNIGYKVKDHELEAKVEYKEIKLTENDRKPACLCGPLINKIIL